LGQPIVDYRSSSLISRIQAHAAPPHRQLTTRVLGGRADRVPPSVRVREHPHLHRPRRGGTVTLDYGLGSGVVSGAWSETYSNYSDNGKDFVNGTVTINDTSAGAGTYTSNLTMTGADTGSDEITFNSATGVVHGRSTYDGHTVSGPSAPQAAKGACPSIQPKEPELHVTATRVRNGVYRIKVTSSIAGAGTNEASVETSPVYHATVTLGTVTAYTSLAGVAIVSAGPSRKLTVTAGDTLAPTSLSISRR
jgi:hypothetical protein